MRSSQCTHRAQVMPLRPDESLQKSQAITEYDMRYVFIELNTFKIAHQIGFVNKNVRQT